ncbi:heterogeneous nuclear ribonucleoprotein D0-like [Zingiber officinale]|uniref:heterogeneous nuclear ribonucleoprotein D0-like n=1 Tax=Zingiber officinale TaxID=94328 RepID=UPI001C4A93AA|nr:heterogeneous nuclear ribonucleoprotein D0-like [Zingiber officinale]
MWIDAMAREVAAGLWHQAVGIGVKLVFVNGLPPFWDEDKVKEQFKDFGEIEKVVLARNMSTVKRKDFGFVNFTSHAAVVACVEGINNTGLTYGKIKMKVRARLANPFPKTQAVKGGMSGGYRIGYTSFGAYSRFGRGGPLEVEVVGVSYVRKTWYL